MTTEMVERVARAIGESKGWRLPAELGTYAEDSHIGQCMKSARAAIRALMEPRIIRAIEVVLCESNGISDNEWKLKDGTVWESRWSNASYVKAIGELDAVFAMLTAALGEDR